MNDELDFLFVNAPPIRVTTERLIEFFYLGLDANSPTDLTALVDILAQVGVVMKLRIEYV
jgi:hypothetical protein